MPENYDPHMSDDALKERVFAQGGQIRELGGQIRDLATDTKAMIASLASETKLAISSLSSETKRSLDTVMIKFDEQQDKRGSNWLAIAGIGLTTLFTSVAMAAGLSFTILSLRVAPFEGDSKRLESQQEKNAAALVQLTEGTRSNFDKLTDIVRSTYDKTQERLNKDFVARTEVDEIKNAQLKDLGAVHDAAAKLEAKVDGNAADRRATSATLKDLAGVQTEAAVRSAFNKERIEGLTARVQVLENKTVSREEHERKWGDFQRQIDQLSGRFDQLYPAATFLKDLQSEVTQLRSKLIEIETRREK